MTCAEYEEGVLSSMRGVQRRREVSASNVVLQGGKTKPNCNQPNFIMRCRNGT